MALVKATRSVLLIHGMSSSQGTWWRTGPALEARGWQVDTVDLAGHGGRPIGATRSLTALAGDVLAQRPGGSTLVVGHSLGAIVALQLLTEMPTYARGVVLEDPPGRGARPMTEETVEHIAREVHNARTDPAGAIASLLRGHPTWTRRDARSVVAGRLLTDPGMLQLPPGDRTWELAMLVATCPVPVALVAAAGGYSALVDPDRSAVMQALPAERVTELPGSHHVHLDAPGEWVEAVDTFGSSLL